ncbi:hypothetical protein H4Q26_004568 [Puccinia striiformis f. sp. tritici PST-130]|nr:hypothetical protein H4Q26_004568 [Puccinia striiformis f. sp. tritici PST-130]
MYLPLLRVFYLHGSTALLCTSVGVPTHTDDVAEPAGSGVGLMYVADQFRWKQCANEQEHPTITQ